MRINDAHDRNPPGGLDDPLMSPMKRDNRDCILGGGGMRRTACDFAVPAARDYKLALAGEAIGAATLLCPSGRRAPLTVLQGYFLMKPK